MAYDAAPDAPVYMTHAGMLERVRYLERWSRQHKNLCDDRHKWTVDRVKWMVDRVNYLTSKMEALSRNIDKYLDVKTDAALDIKTDMDSVKTMAHDLKSDIDRINSVLLKIDPDAVEQVCMDRLRTHGDAMLARLGIPNPKRHAEVVDSAPIEVHRNSYSD